MERTYGFLVICALMIFLWWLRQYSEREPTFASTQLLNSFQCPETIVNDYDCKRFNLTTGVYPFYFESERALLNVNISLKLYRRVNMEFNRDHTQMIEATLNELFLDSQGYINDKETKSTHISLRFECKANEYTCGPAQPIIFESHLSKGKHYYTLLFDKPAELAKTIRNVEIFMESYDQNYQGFVFNYRLDLLALIIISTCLYYISLKKAKYSEWSVEQKWVLLLSLAVMSLNNPLSLFYYRFGYSFLVFFSRLLVIFSLTMIVPFWLSTLRDLRLKQHIRFITFAEVLFGVITAFFATSCILFTSETFCTLFKTTSFITGGTMVYQVIRNLLSKQKLSWADRLYMPVTLYFAATYLDLMTRWGNPGDLFEGDQSKALSLITTFTVYLLMCQYLYARRTADSLHGINETISLRKAYDELREDREGNEFDD